MAKKNKQPSAKSAESHGFKDSPFGRIPEEWEAVKLSNLCSLEYGSGLLQKDYDSFSESFVYGTSGIMGKSHKFLNIGESVVIGRKGTINSPIYIPKDQKFWVIDTAFYLKSVESIKYLFYLFTHINFLKYNESTGIPSLNRNTFYQIQVLIPKSRVEQSSIASILSTLDEAIEKTDRLIAKYKHIKQGLMQDLFRYGIDENGGIRSEQTHRFKDSPLGRIPEEWEVKGLYSILTEDIKNGYSPLCTQSGTGKYILTLEAVSSKGLDTSKCKPAPLDDLTVDRYLLNAGDFLVSRSNTRNRVGLSALYTSESRQYAYPDLLMKFRIDNNVVTDIYLSKYLYSHATLAYLQGNASGTSASMVKINKQILRKLPIIIPPLPEQSRIASILSASDKAIEKEQAYRHKLLALKRGLMEDLLTGKVRVPQTSINL